MTTETDAALCAELSIIAEQLSQRELYGAAQTMLRAASRIEALGTALKKAREGLEDARNTIRAFNGIGIPQGRRLRAWQAYQASPEMKRMTAVFAEIDAALGFNEPASTPQKTTETVE